MAAIVCCFSTAGFAQTTGTLVGTVKDTQGAVIPGATITLISEARGTTLETTSADNGDFSFTNVIGDKYTVRVTLTGFKTTERQGISVSPGDRVVLGSLAIEVGSLEETVTVSGEADDSVTDR